MLGRGFSLGAAIGRWLKRPSRRAVSPTLGSQRFHSVAIRAPSGACAAAQALRETRYLAAEAPRLPLPGCDRNTCKCSFVHHGDRREDTRRAADLDLPQPAHAGPEVRSGRGRRRSDRSDDDDDEYFEYVGKRPRGDGDP